MRTSHIQPETQALWSPRPQPLSRSSFSLLGEGRQQRPELRKSASSTVWQTQRGEASTVPQVPEEDGYQAESTAQGLAASPRPQPKAVAHWRSSTVGNVSAMGSGDLCCLQAPNATAMKRSHSDLARSTQTRGHGRVRKASLSCSALGGSPIPRAPLPPGNTSGLERDQGPEDEVAPRTAGTSDSAWTLGESQVWASPLDLDGTTANSSSPEAGPKATGQLATTSCRALPPAAALCSMREVGATELLMFPKLVASVSESGLQAQHGLKLHCRPPGGLRGHSQCCAHPWGPSGLTTEPDTKTKDMWTMTSASDLAPSSAQDAAVHTAPRAVCKAVATCHPLEASVALHMFPEGTVGPSLDEAASPVHNVRWDAEGMTWEVYGAAVDPEVLDVAIQKHLDMQFEQLQRAPTSKDSLSVEGRRGPLRAVMQSLWQPSCCGCSSAAPE
ncbi:PREDICTED: G protein-regulated inducer of neurite outgrowth 2-like [Chrysochloris asiatica]|uniref:G protein-regulated inducer of neurite outgrowth 2-like n=1 Tax=Chrysochloris asiatica TaxID=185453 RepID=A0A9B0X117_CHRAS|nr:PREDICTED: G protein-regulated inducer of neurite outgrowth 2-like [Chrysochloris asiatica]